MDPFYKSIILEKSKPVVHTQVPVIQGSPKDVSVKMLDLDDLGGPIIRFLQLPGGRNSEIAKDMGSVGGRWSMCCSYRFE